MGMLGTYRPPDYLNMSNGCPGGPTPTGSGGPQCSAIAACCPGLDNALQVACDEVAAEGDETTCQAQYTAFCP
jgi:hypothetical protein